MQVSTSQKAFDVQSAGLQITAEFDRPEGFDILPVVYITARFNLLILAMMDATIIKSNVIRIRQPTELLL